MPVLKKYARVNREPEPLVSLVQPTELRNVVHAIPDITCQEIHVQEAMQEIICMFKKPLVSGRFLIDFDCFRPLFYM